MDISTIFKNNEAWITNKLRNDPDYFGKLSSGQSPQLLYIGCSDSRVSAEEIMGLGPGEVFVHRNIANLVNNIDLNTQSVIDYAVRALEIPHLVVCGHYKCGGVEAALRPQNLGLLNPWLRNIRDVYRLHEKELNSIENEDQRYDRLVELNVIEQCINLIKIASVQEAYNKGLVTIHGWVMDLKTGRIIDLGIDIEKEMTHIKEIYDLGT
ncbi:MAG: carbonic anhydrase [Saprospiraceae bacterium]|nr:carbonic anhydrase [Candidatus Parvibacillus calidus]MCC7147922.1 carbonic anhydrase [Saprospiraceae bacterium]